MRNQGLMHDIRNYNSSDLKDRDHVALCDGYE